MTQFQKALSEKVITLVCCKRDKRTSDAVCSVSALNDTVDTIIRASLALVEKWWIQSETQRMSPQYPQGPETQKTEALSTETIYSKLIGDVQQLFVEGRTSAQGQAVQL